MCANSWVRIEKAVPHQGQTPSPLGPFDNAFMSWMSVNPAPWRTLGDLTAKMYPMESTESSVYGTSAGTVVMPHLANCQELDLGRQLLTIERNTAVSSLAGM